MNAGRTDAAGQGAPHSGEDDRVAGLADLLVASLETLARLGEVDAACRTAGRACAVLRKTDPTQWRKFNVLLHRLSRHPAAMP